MAGISISIANADQAQIASPAAIPLLIGCCSLVSSGVYQFDAGADVAATLGGGPLADVAYAFLRTPGVSRIVVAPATQTWTTAPSVSQSGSGPVVALALDSASGCFDDHTLLFTIKKGGANGVALMDVAYDGATVVDTVPVPVEKPAVVRGSVNLTSSVPAMNGLTLVFTAPSSTTITFATSPSTPQTLVDAFNALAVSGGLAVRARVAETASGIFFELYTTSVGVSAGITIDATSTGEGTLGLSTTAATGTAAVLSLPYTGLKATFASGTYVLNETYTATCTAPRPSLAEEAAALTAAYGAIADKPFGFVVFVHPSTTAANCAARQSAHSTTLASYLASTSNPIALYHVVGGVLHTASSTLATNDTNIATADDAMLTAFQGSSAALDSVAPGGFFLAGSPTLRAGTYRRSAAVAWGMRRAGAAKLADDVGSDDLPEGTLIFNSVRERDENRATNKLGGGQGPGFSVLAAKGGSLREPRFEPGATRHGASSRFRYSGPVAVACEVARLTRPIVTEWRGRTFPVDPLTRNLLEGARQERREELHGVLKKTLMTGEGFDLPFNVSAFEVVVKDPASGTFYDNGQIPVDIPIIFLGETEAVTVRILGTGAITVA